MKEFCRQLSYRSMELVHLFEIGLPHGEKFYLKGVIGDHINLLMTTCAWNFK